MTVTSHRFNLFQRLLLVRDNKAIISAWIWTPIFLLVRKEMCVQLGYRRVPAYRSNVIQMWRPVSGQKHSYGNQNMHGSTTWKTGNYMSTQNSWRDKPGVESLISLPLAEATNLGKPWGPVQGSQFCWREAGTVQMFRSELREQGWGCLTLE